MVPSPPHLNKGFPYTTTLGLLGGCLYVSNNRSVAYMYEKFLKLSSGDGVVQCERVVAKEIVISRNSDLAAHMSCEIVSH